MSRIEKIITGRDTTPPLTPATIQVVGVTASSIALQCATSSDPTVPGEARTGVVAYRWYVSLDGASFSLVGQTSVPAFTHLGLAASTRYYYRVSAVDFIGLESDLSAVASGLTDSGTVENRAPVWSSAPLTIDAYPGKAVSRQLVAGSVANAVGVDVWDVDGDQIQFSEVATAVLSQLGLSVSSTGLIAGTIPAGAEPQSLTFQVSASDGQLSATKTGTVQVYDQGDAVTDWEARSQGPGVFWATNGEEWVRGIPGYTSQPTKGYPAGQPGRLTTPIADISQLPMSEAVTLLPVKWRGDIGDGAGHLKLEATPGVAGKFVKVRIKSVEEYSYTDGKALSEWPILPWAWVPADYRDSTQGTGQPNERRGLKGTVGEGSILPFLETWARDGVTSKNNPAKRPMVRQFWMQFLVEVPPEQWGYRHRMYNPQWANPVPRGDWDNKIVFVTGGQTGDQYAMKLDNALYFSSMGYRATITGGVSMALGVTVKGPTGDRSITIPHTAIRLPGWDALTSSMRAEDWMIKRGPAYEALIRGVGVYPDGVTRFTPDLGWYDPESPDLGSLSYEDANKLWNPARTWPYGGYPTDGTAPWPGLGWTHEATAGITRPGVPHVVEVFFSEQVSRPIDQDQDVVNKNTDPNGLYGPWGDDPKGPRIVAVWAAPYGEEPVLLHYTGSNGRNGSSMIPSRVFHRASGADGATTAADDATTFKFQENAIDENRSNCGFMIVGALDGFPEPTSTEFYALRAQPVGSGSANQLEGQYTAIAANKGGNPGTVHNWGGGLVMGFARGELAGRDYRPAQPSKNWQFAILRTSYTGQTITTVNGYLSANNLASDPVPWSVTGPVHKFEFASALPVVPRARSADYTGDCFNVIFNKELQRPLGRSIKFGQVIFSMQQVPFPGHLDKPLPWPEPWV